VEECQHKREKREIKGTPWNQKGSGACVVEEKVSLGSDETRGGELGLGRGRRNPATKARTPNAPPDKGAGETAHVKFYGT